MKKLFPVLLLICLPPVFLSAATVQVDLTGVFDRDTILCPDDEAGALGGDFDGLDIDLGTGWAFTMEGWDGAMDNPLASGPPEDGVVSDYQLGPYDGPNAIHLCTDDDGIETQIDVPQGKYTQARFLVSGGDGDSNIPITFEYATGDSVDSILYCDDWFDDYPDLDAGNSLRTELSTVTDGWDRVNLATMALDDGNDPGVFASTMDLDPDRELVSIVLKPGADGTWFERTNQASPTSLNLYAINLDSVANQPPEATITSDPSDPQEFITSGDPIEVILTCEANDPDDGPQELTYSWGLESSPPGSLVIFTPLLPVTDPVITASLDLPGDYRFGCRVSDGAEAILSTITITITCENKVPLIDLQLSATEISSGSTFTADATNTSDPDSGPEEMTFHWDFVTGAMTQIDLTDSFNQDGVYEPGGDYLSSGIDQGGLEFVVEGWDGIVDDNPNAQGFPADGHIDIFQLAPYDGLNTIQLSNTSPEIVIEIASPHIASSLIYLVTGGSGDSTLAVDIKYDDGTTQQALMYCDDWFDDENDGNLRTKMTPVLNGLDRTDATGIFQDSNDPGLFKGEIILDEPDIPIVSITLKPTAPESSWAGDGCRFNLFDLWANGGGVNIVSPDSPKTDISINGAESEYTFMLTVDDGDTCTNPVSQSFSITVTGGGAGTMVYTGDANSDGSVNLADAITVLSYLFASGDVPGCLKSADTNDDDSVNLADAINILSYQFSSGFLISPDGIELNSQSVGCSLYPAEEVSSLGCNKPCQ